MKKKCIQSNRIIILEGMKIWQATGLSGKGTKIIQMKELLNKNTERISFKN